MKRETAETFMTKAQAIVGCIMLAIVVIGLLLNAMVALQVMVACAIFFYLLFVGMKLTLAIAAKGNKSSNPRVMRRASNLPTYTIFLPMYKEANMLPTLVEAIERLDYPKDKLQVILALESRDPETLGEARAMDLPNYFEIVVVPDKKPYGKPKALNVALEKATGEFCVIYDAEDRPDPDQLLKAIAVFMSSPADVACLQARLNFWNRDTNWLTSMYWMEYLVHFEQTLPGFAKLGLVPPLGGTSNHFRTEVVRKVGGWDGWNVTEDADLAGALALYGYRILTFDSWTDEEATAGIKIADMQRRRWLKGHLQTGLVMSRHPLQAMRNMGALKWFCFELQMLGTALSLVLNPLFWAMTIIYAITHSSVIMHLYSAPVFYTGVGLMIVGNMSLILQLLIAAHKHQGEHLTRDLFLVFVWWGFMSWSMYNVIVELAIPSKRYVWHKTMHGHDLKLEAQLANSGKERYATLTTGQLPAGIPSNVSGVHVSASVSNRHECER